MATPKFPCANWSSCKKEGKLACKDCRLVAYCGAKCQRAHRPEHRSDCTSPLGKKDWRPDWDIENRKPAFVGGNMATAFGTAKYLWGNMPAFDLLKLKENEGETYDGDLKILVAASGDLRNIVKTIADLPQGYSGKLEMVVNDLDLDIVARNVIILLIILSSGDDERNEAVDVIIHFWYSALLRKSDMDFLRTKIKPLIQDVCDKVSGKDPGAALAKEWTFGRCSMRLVLEKSAWDKVLSYFDAVPGLTPERANDIRVAVTLAPSRKDYLHRHYGCLSPSARVAANRFREDGLLLPFGAPTAEFQVPNPTFFRNGDEWVMLDSADPLQGRSSKNGDEWVMLDSADPLQGWSSEEIVETSSGAATGDIYGKLFHYLRAIIGESLTRLSKLETRFRVFQVDATDLPKYLEADCDSFCRVEVSNITDGGWLGTSKVLSSMTPMLQKPTENKHATLVALYMNAVIETETLFEGLASARPGSTSARLALTYLPPPVGLRNDSDPWIMKFLAAVQFTSSYDAAFERYMKQTGFFEMSLAVGAEIKDKHTIVDQWPFKVKLQPDQPGAQKEFDRLLGSGGSGKERYVEWKRTSSEGGAGQVEGPSDSCVCA